MTAHQKLIQRHSPKWDQTDMPVFHLKAPDMFPEFRMDIKIQRDIFLFQKSLKPLILREILYNGTGQRPLFFPVLYGACTGEGQKSDFLCNR